jgi:hypothetical protein
MTSRNDMAILCKGNVACAIVRDDIAGVVRGCPQPRSLKICDGHISRGRWRAQRRIEKGGNQNRAQRREGASRHGISPVRYSSFFAKRPTIFGRFDVSRTAIPGALPKPAGRSKSLVDSKLMNSPMHKVNFKIHRCELASDNMTVRHDSSVRAQQRAATASCCSTAIALVAVR